MLMKMPFMNALLILLALIHSGMAIKCYSCMSQSSDNLYSTHANCSDPTKLYSYECTSNLVHEMNNRISGIIGSNADELYMQFGQIVCQKLELQLPNGENFLSRSCQMGRIYSIDPCKKFEETLRYNHGFKLRHCSTCDRDVCNSSQLNTLSMGTLVALFALGVHHYWVTIFQS